MSGRTLRALLVSLAAVVAVGGCSDGGDGNAPAIAAVVEGEDIPGAETEKLLHSHLDEGETAAGAGHGHDGDREERAGHFVLLYQIKHALIRHLAAEMGLPEPPPGEEAEAAAGRLSREMAERLFPAVEITEAELRSEYERRAGSPEPFAGVPAGVDVAVPSFEEVHAQLRTHLLEQRRQALFADWFGKALRTADIVVDEHYGRWDAGTGGRAVRRLGAFLLPAILIIFAAGIASAAPELELRVERDLRPSALSSELAVNLKVSVFDRATGTAPTGDFVVYAYADAAGKRTEIYPCAEEHDNAPDAPRGVYLCTVLVDHGGTWVFRSVANQPQADEDAPPVTLGEASAEFTVDTTEVAGDTGEDAVEGRVADVVLLWSHAASAGGWLVAAGLVSVLALPGARRRLSRLGVHRLEERFDLIIKGFWAATGLVVGSGIWLLLNQTAYETPFSSSALDGVFSLPYGKPYFVALGLKLALYGLMLAAVLSLTREARRRLRVDDDPRPSALARLGACALLAGGFGVSVAVTVIKYCHELIEAAGAVT